MAFDKSIKVVARVGDRDPLNDGGAILDHGDGRPTLIWLESFEDAPVNTRCEQCGIGEKCRLQFLKFGVDILDIDDAVNGPGNQWVEVKGVSTSCGVEESELKRMAASDDIREKAMAVWIVAGYHGWENFDSYPAQLNHDEAQQFADDLDEAEKRGRG